MKIYIDVFFLVNACMNFIVLTGEGMLLRQKIRFGRTVLSSVAGAFLAVAVLAAGVHTYKMLFALVYPAGIIFVAWMAFGKAAVWTVLCRAAVFFVMSALLAAFVVWLQGVGGGKINFPVLLMGGAVFLSCLHWWIPRLRQKKIVCENICRLELAYGGRRIDASGFFDTGNHLREPFGGEQVAVADAGLVGCFLSGEDSPVCRCIPFHSVGRKIGVMRAFRLDEMVVVRADGSRETIERPWIAVSDTALAQGGEYQVILHPDMLQKTMVN